MIFSIFFLDGRFWRIISPEFRLKRCAIVSRSGFFIKTYTDNFITKFCVCGSEIFQIARFKHNFRIFSITVYWKSIFKTITLGKNQQEKISSLFSLHFSTQSVLSIKTQIKKIKYQIYKFNEILQWIINNW